MDGPLRFESLPTGSSVNGGKLLELNAVKPTGPARCDKHARRTEWRKRHLPEGDARLRGKGHQQRERQAERDSGRTGLRTPRRRRSRELPRPRGTPSPSGDPRSGLRPRLPGLPRRPGVRENPAERTTRLELDLDSDERPPARRLGAQEGPRHRGSHRDRREFRPPRAVRGGASGRVDADRPTENPDNLWSQGDGDAARVFDRGILSAQAQYSFGFACGSFQYGRVVTYLNFASNRSFKNSFSVSCIFARILLAVVGPTP